MLSYVVESARAPGRTPTVIRVVAFLSAAAQHLFLLLSSLCTLLLQVQERLSHTYKYCYFLVHACQD